MTRERIEIDLERVEELASQGLTGEQIAAALGVSVRTVYNRKKQDKAFSGAMLRGQAKGVEHVASALMKQIDAGNLTAIIFYLKTRAGWHETQRIEADIHSREDIPEGLPAIYEKLSREQLTKVAAMPLEPETVLA